MEDSSCPDTRSLLVTDASDTEKEASQKGHLGGTISSSITNGILTQNGISPVETPSDAHNSSTDVLVMDKSMKPMFEQTAPVQDAAPNHKEDSAPMGSVVSGKQVKQQQTAVQQDEALPCDLKSSGFKPNINQSSVQLEDKPITTPLSMTSVQPDSQFSPNVNETEADSAVPEKQESKAPKKKVVKSIEIMDLKFDEQDETKVLKNIEEKMTKICSVVKDDIGLPDVHEELVYVYSATRFLGNREKVTARCCKLVDCGLIDLWKAVISGTKTSEKGDYLYITKGPVTDKNRFRTVMSTLWNATDKGEYVCRCCIEKDLLNDVFEAFKYELLSPDVLCSMTDGKDLTYRRWLLKAFLGISHNIAHYVGMENKKLFRDCHAVEVLQQFFRVNILSIKTKVVLTLSYIVSEQESDKLNASDQHIKFILRTLETSINSPGHHSKATGYHAKELVVGLNKMAVSESNKEKIVNNGALPLYLALMKGDAEKASPHEKQMILDEQKEACNGIWTLAFNSNNRAKIKEESELMDTLNKLAQNEDVDSRKAAEGALWVIADKINKQTDSETTAKGDQVQHIMISYNWESQTRAIRVRDMLKNAGYKVWMDIDHISGSILEAMAQAVEKAAVVLVCFSEKYKSSPNCRTEAEYAYQRKKDIVPLRVQKQYLADGWLGALLGMKLYYDISDEKRLPSNVQKVIAELGMKGKLNAGVLDHVDAVRVEPLQSTPVPSTAAYTTWSQDKVTTWWKDHDVPSEVVQSFSGMDGSLLYEMKKMLQISPDFLYNKLNSCDLVTILKITKALESLR